MATLRAIREELRATRKERKRTHRLTLDMLQERSGLDRMTIHKIENVEVYPDYEPGLDTVRRLVEGLGLTLSTFFDKIESPEALRETASEGTTLPSSIQQGPQHGNTPVPTRPLDDTNAVIAANSAAVVLLARTLDRIARDLSGRLRTGSEQDASPRAPTPSRPARRRKAG